MANVKTAWKYRGLIWKYRRPLWKYRALIQHRKEILAIGSVGLGFAGACLVHRLTQARAGQLKA